MMCCECLTAAADDAVVYRIRNSRLTRREALCAGCCQPRLAALRMLGHEILGLGDVA